MKSLNKTEKSWVFYDWANSAYSMAITSTILPLYFKSVFSNAGGSAVDSTAYWGYANSAATLIIAVLAPILGTMADYRGNKMKFFTFFMTMGVGTTALLAFVPDAAWLPLLGVYILTVLGFNGSLIFYDAFLVDVTPTERMDKVSTWGYAMGYIGSTIPFLLCIGLVIAAQVKIIPISVGLASKISFVLTAIWWGAFSMPLLKNVKQLFGVEKEANLIINSFKRIAGTFKNIQAHKRLFTFMIAYFFYIDGVDTIIKMATAYGSDLGISSANLLIILLVTQFVAFPFALLYGHLAETIGTKKMLLIGILIYTGICVYAFFLKTVFDFWILAMLVGTSQGGIQALSRSYFGKLVPKENSNEFFGFYNIFGKFAAIMGPFLMGLVTQMTGRTNYGVLSIVILFLIGGLLLLRTDEAGGYKKVGAA